MIGVFYTVTDGSTEEKDQLEDSVVLVTTPCNSWAANCQKSRIQRAWNLALGASYVRWHAVHVVRGTRPRTRNWIVLATAFVTHARDKGFEIPANAVRDQNYPAPFNPRPKIKYALSKSSQVTLCVFDILGREVSVLVNERKNTGSYEVKFDGSGLSSGVYFYRLQAGDFVHTRKLLIVR